PSLFCPSPFLSRSVFFPSSIAPRALPSFPTRRSSDLVDDGDRKALLHQVFRNLQADKAAAGNNRALGSGLLQIFPKLDGVLRGADRKSTRLNSSHVSISYAVFCLKKKNNYFVYDVGAS